MSDTQPVDAGFGPRDDEAHAADAAESQAAEPNVYEIRQAERRARYEQQAAKANAEANAAFGKARRIGDMIPFGQPILLGHHSEGRHRRDLKRIDDSMRKGVEATARAEHYERKAASVGLGGISSDDPEAIPKLQAKLAELEATHARLKATSKALRAKDPKAALAALGFTAEQSAALLAPNYMGRPSGVESWQLTNSSANIRQVKQRIEQLKAAAKRPVPEAREVAGVRVEESAEDNRLRLVFPGKPSEAVRDLLKRWGFRFSRKNMAWQRHRSNAANYAAEQVLAAVQREAGSAAAASPDVALAIAALRGDLDADPIHRTHATRLVDTGDVLVETCQVCEATDIGVLFRPCQGVAR